MRDFYSSFSGLCDWKKSKISHLLVDPVELLANCKVLYLVNARRSFHIQGRGRLMTIPLPVDVRELLSRVVPRDRPVPKRFWDLVSWPALRRDRGMSVDSAIRSIVRFYRITPKIRNFLHYFCSSIEVEIAIQKYGIGVSLETLRVLEYEELLRSFKTQTNKKNVILYKQNYARLDCMRTVLDGVALCFQYVRKTGVNIPSSAISALNKLKDDVWRDPWGTAKAIKSLATECRGYYFGLQRPMHPLVSWLGRSFALQFLT